MTADLTPDDTADFCRDIAVLLDGVRQRAWLASDPLATEIMQACLHALAAGSPFGGHGIGVRVVPGMRPPVVHGPDGGETIPAGATRRAA